METSLLVSFVHAAMAFALAAFVGIKLNQRYPGSSRDSIPGGSAVALVGIVLFLVSARVDVFYPEALGIALAGLVSMFPAILPKPRVGTWRQWREGNTARYERQVRWSDINWFARITGDTNPVHLDESYARTTPFGRRIAHGMLTASYISAVLGTKLPGPGAIYLSQSLKFLHPVYLGDRITTIVTVRSIDDKGRMVLETVCINGDGTRVLEGEAQVLYRRPSLSLPRSMKIRPEF
jgi:3-hydroxybutyryl-CoA dehydratase